MYLRGNQLRIMKNPADNPATTPRTDYHKFAFDSQSGDLAYAYGINANPASVGYYPLISSMAMFESGWWELQSAFVLNPSGRFITTTSAFGRTYHPVNAGGPISASVGTMQFNPGATIPAPIDTRYMLWQLPSTNAASPFPSSTGSVGRILKTPSALRVPRAGYLVSDTNPFHHILHEALRPAKVVAAGRVSLGAGGSVTIPLPGVATTNLFVGGQFSEAGATVVQPFLVEAGYTGNPVERRVQVAIGSGYIVIRERSGYAADVSYYVIAEDQSAPTSGGGGSFIRSGGTGADRYFQIVRPGASAAPSMTDILVDSRWQTMPLIAEGFVSAGSFGAPNGENRRGASVTFPALGYKPLVLANWWFDRMSAAGSFLVERWFSEGRTCFWYETTPPAAGYVQPRFYTGNTCYTRIADGSAEFVNYFGNPIGWDVVFQGPGYRYTPRWPGFGDRTNWQDFVGVRYYVFAIPQG